MKKCLLILITLSSLPFSQLKSFDSQDLLKAGLVGGSILTAGYGIYSIFSYCTSTSNNSDQNKDISNVASENKEAQPLEQELLHNASAVSSEKDLDKEQDFLDNLEKEPADTYRYDRHNSNLFFNSKINPTTSPEVIAKIAETINTPKTKTQVIKEMFIDALKRQNPRKLLEELD